MTEGQDPRAALRGIQLHTGDRQSNYDKRVAHKLLLTHVNLDAYSVARDAGEDFGLDMYSREWARLPLAFASYKANKPVNLNTCFNIGKQKGEIWKAYAAECRIWPGRLLALAFDHHADGVSDLIMHGSGECADGAPVLITVRQDGEPDLYIQDLCSFLRKYSEV